ncbi:MAG: hypothetical protein JST30_09750 [Armatimonadetes bacterium]|nr:hypothetical protein [Armatimonadota bacterium]
MSLEEKTQLAVALMRIGVSKRGVEELLTNYPVETIKRQLAFLPFRKARRPEALIVESIRNDFSPPKEFYYASNQAHPSSAAHAVDEGAQPSDPNLAPDLDRHGTAAAPDPVAPDHGLEQAGVDGDLAVPPLDAMDW